MHLRRLLAETPVFLELKARRALASDTPLKAVLRDYRGAVVLSGLLTWMLPAAIVSLLPDPAPFRFQLSLFFDGILPPDASPLIESYFVASPHSPRTAQAGRPIGTGPSSRKSTSGPSK